MAVSTAEAVLAWIGLGLGLGIALVVVVLFNSILRPARQIKRYSEHILEGGVGIAKNVDDVEELGRTVELGSAVPGLAASYLEKVRGST